MIEKRLITRLFNIIIIIIILIENKLKEICVCVNFIVTINFSVWWYKLTFIKRRRKKMIIYINENFDWSSIIIWTLKKIESRLVLRDFHEIKQYIMTIDYAIKNINRTDTQMIFFLMMNSCESDKKSTQNYSNQSWLRSYLIWILKRKLLILIIIKII